jgi:hypothetical protein
MERTSARQPEYSQIIVTHLREFECNSVSNRDRGRGNVEEMYEMYV